MWINRRPGLSPTVYTTLQSFVGLKADMHNIYVRERKDLGKQWVKLPFVATDDIIFNVIDTWPPECCAPDIAEIENLVVQRKKDEAKLRIAQLDEKRRKEAVTAKVRALWDAAQKAVEQEKVAATVAAQEAAAKAGKGQIMPS